jgi:uncharacterized protein involved in outer membrane biogenesis
MTVKSRLAIFGTPIVLIVLLILFWNWDWFIPAVEYVASSSIGRKVTLAHLHVRLGRVTQVVADDVQVANPDGFATPAPFVQVAHLTIEANVEEYLRHRTIVLPLIDLDNPEVEAIATAAGANNFSLTLPQSGSPAPASPATSPQIGNLTIEDGHVHAVIPKFKTDFNLTLQTKPATGAIAQQGQQQAISVEARGTYAGQPITGTLMGGALLSLQQSSRPYPVDLHLANGSTRVSLTGTVKDPMAFKGADLRLVFSGDNMAELFPLTGIPIPATPRFSIAGQLDYADNRFRFEDFRGTVGNSDLGGTITEDPGRERPDVTMDLHSNRVDLADLRGFVGAAPGGAHEAGATASQRAVVAKEEASDAPLLPTTPINIPKVKAADIHLRYHADHIEGNSMPLDQLIVAMDSVDGAIDLHPLSFTVGSGKISGNISLTPVADNRVHAKADIDFDRVDVARLLASTHLFTGAGAIGGRAELDATGNSIATWAGDGNGGLTLYMAGGNLSSVLVDLAGLEFGNAIISALGIPGQTDVQCFIGNWSLQHGDVDTRTLLLDTGEAIISGQGTVDLKDQRINFSIEGKPKHFSIGSFPAPIEVTGTLKHPSVGPAIKPLLARGGAAAVLGVLAAPLAILPTIQLGVGDPHQCGDLVAEAKADVQTGKPGAALKADTASPAHATGHGTSSTSQLNQEELKQVRNRKP